MSNMPIQAQSTCPDTIDPAIAEEVYGHFHADSLVSRKKLDWVRRKLRKYCGLPAEGKQAGK